MNMNHRVWITALRVGMDEILHLWAMLWVCMGTWACVSSAPQQHGSAEWLLALTDVGSYLSSFTHWLYDHGKWFATLFALILLVCMLGGIQFFVTSWTVAHQTPLPMEFSRQKYWSRLPFATPGDLPNLGIKPTSYVSCIDKQILYQLCHLESLYICQW